MQDTIKLEQYCKEMVYLARVSDIDTGWTSSRVRGTDSSELLTGVSIIDSEHIAIVIAVPLDEGLTLQSGNLSK